MKKRLLILLLIIVFPLTVFSQKTFIGSTTNWNTAANWSPNGVPTASDDVIIPSGKSVSVTTNSYAKSITISGSLSLIDGVTLTVGTSSLYGNFTVNSGGSFTMPAGSSVAVLIVYGNYYNNGTTDFWKSNVIIVGDLLSPSSSALQNQGNVVVGGNIIGAFSLTGGTGSNQIYAVNPNSTVDITPASIDNNVPPGGVVTETPLVNLVNSVIFGNTSCTFSINDPSNKSVCAGTNTTFTVSTTQSNPTYQWQVNAGTGWNDLVNNTTYSGVTSATLTLTSVATSMNGYKYRAKITSGCSKNGNFATLSVNAAPTLPTVSVTQPNCSTSTGSISVTVQNGTDTYSFDNGVTFQSNNIKSSLISGNYNVIIKNTNGCSSSVLNTTISPSTSTWNGSSWSPSSPTSNDKIVFNGNYSSTGDLSGCSCQVTSGTIVFNSGHTLNLTNEIAVLGGSITFENTASLVQTNNSISNSGAITFKRKTTPLKQYDFTYWSSPVFGAQLSQLSTNSAFFSYDTSVSNWSTQTSATVMAPGVGYIGRAPSNLTYNPTQIVETSFVGTPNNGNIIVPILKSTGTSNLIGNPYPSAIDADLFLTDASNVNNINGTIYLWTHNTAMTNNNYNSNDYAKYNIIGGVKTSSAALSGGTTPTGKIAAGQGFFIEANSNLVAGNYSVTFKNSMRVINNNNDFFKTNSSTIAQSIEKHRFWISMSTSQGAYNEFLVGYVQGATNNFDTLFDGRTIPSGNSVAIYSVLENNNLAIQGRSLPFDTNDIIPIGYTTSINGQLTINLENFDGIFDNQDIYLLDKVTGIYQNLKTNSYTFTTNNGTFNDRFEIHFTSNALSNNSINLNNGNKVSIIAAQGNLEVSSNIDSIAKIEMYDIVGKLIYAKDKMNINVFQSELNNSDQFLVVKVTLQNGNTITKKVNTNRI